MQDLKINDTVIDTENEEKGRGQILNIIPNRNVAKDFVYQIKFGDSINNYASNFKVNNTANLKKI